jgi:uncharacterized membrane protein
LSFGHCVVCPLIFDFWLPIGIFTLWPLYYLSFDFRLLIANWYLHTFGHCVVCSLIYGFWLPIGIFTLLAIVLSVLWFLTSVEMSEDTNGQSEVENQRTDNTMAKSVKIPMGNQKSWIKEQIIQWPKVWRYQLAIRSRKSKNRQHNGQKCEDTNCSDCPLVSSHFWPLYYLSFDFRLLIAHWYLQTFLFSVCYFFIYLFIYFFKVNGFLLIFSKSSIKHNKS